MTEHEKTLNSYKDPRTQAYIQGLKDGGRPHLTEWELEQYAEQFNNTLTPPTDSENA